MDGGAAVTTEVNCFPAGISNEEGEIAILYMQSSGSDGSSRSNNAHRCLTLTWLGEGKYKGQLTTTTRLSKYVAYVPLSTSATMVSARRNKAKRLRRTKDPHNPLQNLSLTAQACLQTLTQSNLSNVGHLTPSEVEPCAIVTHLLVDPPQCGASGPGGLLPRRVLRPRRDGLQHGLEGAHQERRAPPHLLRPMPQNGLQEPRRRAQRGALSGRHVSGRL